MTTDRNHILRVLLPSATLVLFSSNGLTSDIPLFKEQALQAGIEHEYHGPWEYFVGGGVAALDCNQDRFPDLVFAGGSEPAALFINQGKRTDGLSFKPEALLNNDSNPNPNNVPGQGHRHGPRQVTGVYSIDLDNDGLQDLVLLRVGRNLILKGEKDCRFSAANEHFGISGGNEWTTAFAATYEKGNSFPSLVFGNYVDRTAPGSPWGTCSPHGLYRPSRQSANSSSPQYLEPVLLEPGHCALSLLFTDWNKSGTASLRVTNDRQYHRNGQEQLWRFDAGNQPRLYRSADGWKRMVIWGMGIAEGDLNGDGYPEYALTSMGDTKVQQLDLENFIEEGKPVYEDIAYTLGATAHRPYTGDDLNPSTGWHSEFADMNNDARLDLYIAKGNVEQMADFAAFDPDNLLLAQSDGAFTEVGDEAGIALDRRGRGATIVDLDLDGMLDLLVVNREKNVSLFRQTGSRHGDHVRPTGNWLQIELNQSGANRDAIGATVSIKTGNHTQIRTVSIGGGHASGSHGFIHVGLGVAERASVRVKWPDGQWSAPYRAFANQFVIIERNAPQAVLWYPPATSD